MSTPGFAMVTEGTFRSLKADDQNDIFFAAEEYLPGRETSNRNAIKRWEAVNEAKQAYWSAVQAEPKHKTVAIQGEISADQINERLKCLPPLEFGETP